MLDVLGALKAAFKISTVDVDNPAFKLHYKATFILLVCFSLLVTLRSYVGDPIDCVATDKSIDKVIDQYCWVSGTYTLETTTFDLNEHGHQGLGNSQGKGAAGKERVYHSYYQWVCFVLFLQAMMFYVPHYIWKIWEGGRMKSLVAELDKPIVSEATKTARMEALEDYFSNNLFHHQGYVWAFIICEVLNFVNIIGQIYFTDLFLGGEFTTYGSNVVSLTDTNVQNRTDPMYKVFPRVTKCDFTTFGPSGEVQKHDALCVLPVNIINEKLYIMLWFWFIILAVISGLAIVYRLLLLLVKQARLAVFRFRVHLSAPDVLEVVFSEVYLGDWFILYLLSKNINDQVFREFITRLSKRLHAASPREKFELRELP